MHPIVVVAALVACGAARAHAAAADQRLAAASSAQPPAPDVGDVSSSSANFTADAPVVGAPPLILSRRRRANPKCSELHYSSLVGDGDDASSKTTMVCAGEPAGVSECYLPRAWWPSLVERSPPFFPPSVGRAAPNALCCTECSTEWCSKRARSRAALVWTASAHVAVLHHAVRHMRRRARLQRRTARRSIRYPRWNRIHVD